MKLSLSFDGTPFRKYRTTARAIPSGGEVFTVYENGVSFEVQTLKVLYITAGGPVIIVTEINRKIK